MGFSNHLGKYELGRVIGEGNFAKVRLAMNVENNLNVAVKIIDKRMVVHNNLVSQVLAEIKAMKKLLYHPNIVQIHEVIGTKTKIYIVMEYVSGGQLSDKMIFTEKEGRRCFQQLVDAVHYCHGKGVYHRDLKPENILLDCRGNVKLSDFGLSTLQKCPGDLLSTTCGSPSYVAPELLNKKSYDGAAADVWSCGVILFELLVGHLPFRDYSLLKLYKKIAAAEFTIPERLSKSMRNLLRRILEPNPIQRVTLSQIIEDQWFQKEYEPAKSSHNDNNLSSECLHSSPQITGPSKFINAFQLIAMSNDLNLSSIFLEKDVHHKCIRHIATITMDEIVEKVEKATSCTSFLVEKLNPNKLQVSEKVIERSCIKHISLSIEVIEVTPNHRIVEISGHPAGLCGQVCQNISLMLQ